MFRNEVQYVLEDLTSSASLAALVLGWQLRHLLREALFHQICRISIRQTLLCIDELVELLANSSSRRSAWRRCTDRGLGLWRRDS